MGGEVLGYHVEEFENWPDLMKEARITIRNDEEPRCECGRRTLWTTRVVKATRTVRSSSGLYVEFYVDFSNLEI
jgi:hypothetical protein